ncbi:addiction module antidote protein [Candidatus Sulfurimonas baltica]|uniref:Putative addiction module antidote protein n=1 Tax=Candidatus Sulfurimonas baltica TaxID=2740404 RepID=A0A7S7LTC4_9BACT|nr:addiction module antidote protein [Candidatus Sulfurimonas baltica]QOY50993.1 putative addiction module antidote protein [Candidatus Sulfurimonas baltica]
MTKLTTFDVSQYLDSKEMIAEYLTQVLEDGDMNELLEAIGNIAKAKGMSQIAKDTGLGRESLYKTFSADSKPRFETIMKVLDSFGVKLQASA